MDDLKNTNTLIKIEPNSDYDRINNDGGFEALLDEFGPDNETNNSKNNSFSEDIDITINESSINNTDPQQSEQEAVMQINTDEVESSPVPPPDTTSILNSQETNIPNTTNINEHNTPINTLAQQPTNNNTETNTDPRKLKVELKKKRRRTKRSLARAAALVCANGDLSKLTVPIAVSKDPSTKIPLPVNGNCEVVIFPNDYPETEITEEQYHIVQEKFVQEIVEDTSLHVDNWCPRFLDCTFKDGAIYITCLGITTRHWIVATLPKLKLWPDAKLISIDAANLLKLIRVVAWIKRVSLENAQILSLLEKQNEGLSTSKWVIYDRSKPNEKGIRLIVGIDEQSIKVLRDIGGKPFIGLGRAEFTLPEPQVPEKLPIMTTGIHDKPLINKTMATVKNPLVNKTTGTNVGTKPPSFLSNISNPRPSLNVRSPIMNTGISNMNVRSINRPFPSLMQPRGFNLSFNSRMNSNTRYSNSAPWSQ